VPLPAANVVHNPALARGLERLDWSGLTSTLRLEVGLT
jgi:hypothetical protein